MTYDVAFRFQQALDPSALTTVQACLHALRAAIKDCRNAGHSGEADPAILLLARHLGAVACATGGEDGQLRRACMERVSDLRGKPALVALAHKGVAYDPLAKQQFHSDARKALRRIADALGLAEDSYDVRSNRGGIAVSGEITLHGEEVYVQVSLGCMGPGREIMFRRVAGRRDYCGDRNHWGAIRELMTPDRFADRLRRELHLMPPACPSARLVA